MLFELQSIFQHCAEEIKVLVHNGDVVDDCPKCSQQPVAIRPIKGLIYVVRNANQNEVKIGLTTKPMEQRLKSLNSTGVPGDFEPIAIFPSDRPKFDEKRV
jgi:hypothetical protein